MSRFRIVPERSRVWIDAKSNVHPIHSRTDGLEGFIEVEDDLSTVTAARLTLPVARLGSGNALLDREMKRRVDAKRHPMIEGKLTAMEAKGDGRYLVSGEVTFKGVTTSHQDEMTLTTVDDGTIRLEGSSTFDVRDFGMQPPRILMLRVEPEVTVRVEIVAEVP